MHSAFGYGNLILILLVLEYWNEYKFGVYGQEMENICSVFP
jgi:hypothetical protein